MSKGNVVDIAKVRAYRNAIRPYELIKTKIIRKKLITLPVYPTPDFELLAEFTPDESKQIANADWCIAYIAREMGMDGKP